LFAVSGFVLSDDFSIHYTHHGGTAGQSSIGSERQKGLQHVLTSYTTYYLISGAISLWFERSSLNLDSNMIYDENIEIIIEGR